MSALAPNESNIFGFDLEVRLDRTGGWQLLSARAGDLLEAVCDFHQMTDVCSTVPGYLRPPLQDQHFSFREAAALSYSYAIPSAVGRSSRCVIARGSKKSASTDSGSTSSKMLWRATQQFTRFRDIIELVSGIIFLATPHFKNSSDDSGKLLSLVLRSDLTANPKKAFSKADLSNLAYTSWQFEELKLQIPVLSCFETEATKLRSQFWFSKKAVVGSSQPLLTPHIWHIGCDLAHDIELACARVTGKNVST